MNCLLLFKENIFYIICWWALVHYLQNSILCCHLKTCSKFSSSQATWNLAPHSWIWSSRCFWIKAPCTLQLCTHTDVWHRPKWSTKHRTHKGRILLANHILTLCLVAPMFPSTIATSYGPFQTKAFSQMSQNRTMAYNQLRQCPHTF